MNRYSPIALEQSIEFIRDAMAASEEKEQQSRATPSPFESIQASNTSNVCSKFQRPVKNLVGVIGPA